jgi:acetoacetate decarboxylase
MKLDPGKIYAMPLIMGALHEREARPGRVYGEAESLSVTFRTDADAARALVPECFSIPDDPTMTVAFSDYNRVDFMAGDGYRVGYVGVSARFVGRETVDGLCILVMWENRTLPIVTGREMIGIPKIYADISSIRAIGDDRLRATASTWGHEVARLEVVGAKEQNTLVRSAAQKRVNASPWLGYKYIPSFDGPPDASYPMVVWNEVKIDHLWVGKGGSIEFGTAGEDDLDVPARITQALRSLPVGDLVVAAHIRGSGVLRLDRSRRLT